MNYGMYVIYDRIASLYAVPFVQVNDACAKRQFNSMVSQNPGSPTDYELYKLGSWSTDGHLVAFEKPEFLLVGSEA